MRVGSHGATDSSPSGLTLLAVTSLLTVVGPVWPLFMWFRPITIGLAATTAFAITWLAVVIAMAIRHGSKYLWFLLAAPLLLYHPLIYAFMVGCMSSNSCP